MKIKLNSSTLSELQLENLASEFCGKVLSLTEENSNEIEIEFDKENHQKQFEKALTCFAL